jgi:tetratricopeptide (TPR) repeat protein
LDDLYDQIISQQAEMLTAGQKILRNQILRWLLFAVRSLHLPELAHAIAVESNIYIQDLATQATEVCGSLIKIENSQLKLVHHTLREYLLRDIESRTTTIDVDRKQSNLAIAKTLLTYLSHPPSAGIEEPLYDPHYMRTRPIAEYAALYWVYHISNASQNPDLLQQIGQFVDSANFVEWADRLLPHFLPLSMLPTPPRPFNNARFFHLLALKGQLCTYFPESERVEFTNKIETRLRLVYEGFLAEAKAKSGRTSLDVVQRLLDLSELYSWLPGYKSQTRAMLLESSEIISEHISADAGDLSITVTQALADEYKRAGKYAEAKGLLEQFLSNDSLESKDPRRMFALDGLGWVHMRLNNLEAAEITLRNALKLATDLYGKQSPMTLRSKVTLAEVLGKIGRHTEAEALCADLKEQLRQHRHDGVAMSRDSVSQLNTLAMIFAQEEKYEDAKNTWQVVVDDRRKAFGMEHGMTLFAEMQLGNAMKKAGDKAGAKSLFVNLLPRQEKVLGGKHPNVQEVKQQLS